MPEHSHGLPDRCGEMDEYAVAKQQQHRPIPSLLCRSRVPRPYLRPLTMMIMMAMVVIIVIHRTAAVTTFTVTTTTGITTLTVIITEAYGRDPTVL